MPVLKQNEIFAGRYCLRQLIGEGGFSEVWKAEDQMADSAVVAIKIYAPGKGLDDYGLRQFRNEFSITYNLTHPHLLKIYHFDISDGSPYLIMPYCPFGSLSGILNNSGVFSERQAALVMNQIGSALEEVHRQDPPIIHQDIKPDNILVLHPEYFLLADFGISSKMKHTLRKATSNMQSLTVAYAPPERFDRHPTSDTSSDIFSLGVTLYEMCTNTVPWDGSGGQSLLKGACVPALPADFSAELSDFLEACMSVERDKRPTAAEVKEKGRRYLETAQWSAPWIEPEEVKKAPPVKKSIILSLITAVIALAVLGGFWYYKDFYPGSREDTNEIVASPVPVVAEKNESQLENKLKSVETELLQANERLLQQDSLNKILVQNKDAQVVKDQEALANRNDAPPASQKIEKQQSGNASGAGSSVNTAQELQKYLNQISDPKFSKEVRSGWKQEILARFADGSVRVLDESDGTLKEYRAGVFLTLLLTSPHQVVVREVKKDRSNKITELKLSKQHMKSAM